MARPSTSVVAAESAGVLAGGDGAHAPPRARALAPGGTSRWRRARNIIGIRAFVRVGEGRRGTEGRLPNLVQRLRVASQLELLSQSRESAFSYVRPGAAEPD